MERNASQEDLQKVMERMKDAINLKGKGDVVEYNEKLFMPGFSAECLEHMMKEWEMPENSVIISSFPKTGTAWTTSVVQQILYGSDEATLKRAKSIPLPLLLLEVAPKAKFNLFSQLPVDRKIFVTHVAGDCFNFEKMKKQKSKMIYVMRNPKDQTVSWFHFSKRLPIPQEQRVALLGERWDEFYTRYVQGEHPTGLKRGEWYPDHLLGWLKHKDDDSFLVVEYEKMKKDFRGEIQRMAKFLDVDVTETDVNRIAATCSIGSMKKAAESDESGFLKMNVRKGEVGGWKDQFTVSQSEYMDEAVKEKLRGTGIEFTYAL